MSTARCSCVASRSLRVLGAFPSPRAQRVAGRGETEPAAHSLRRRESTHISIFLKASCPRSRGAFRARGLRAPSQSRGSGAPENAGDLAIGPPGRPAKPPLARLAKARRFLLRSRKRASRRSTAAFFDPGHAFSMRLGPHGQPAPGRGSIVSPGGTPGPPGDAACEAARGCRLHPILKTPHENALDGWSGFKFIFQIRNVN